MDIRTDRDNTKEGICNSVCTLAESFLIESNLLADNVLTAIDLLYIRIDTTCYPINLLKAEKFLIFSKSNLPVTVSTLAAKSLPYILLMCLC